MRWIRALDKLPAENQEVLVRLRTMVFLAEFDVARNVFMLKDGTTRDPSKEDLLWMGLAEVSPPPVLK